MFVLVAKTPLSGPAVSSGHFSHISSDGLRWHAESADKNLAHMASVAKTRFACNDVQGPAVDTVCDRQAATAAQVQL